jgi:hypothetical protein
VADLEILILRAAGFGYELVRLACPRNPAERKLKGNSAERKPSELNIRLIKRNRRQHRSAACPSKYRGIFRSDAQVIFIEDEYTVSVYLINCF